MKNRYRVIRDVNGLYQSQIKRWWVPGWMPDVGWIALPGSFYSESLHKARSQIERHKNPRVCYEE